MYPGLDLNPELSLALISNALPIELSEHHPNLKINLDDYLVLTIGSVI